MILVCGTLSINRQANTLNVWSSDGCPEGEVLLIVSNSKAIHYLGDQLQTSLREKMNDNRGHPFTYSYNTEKVVIQPGKPEVVDRVIAETSGRYCEFADIEYQPDMNWCFLRAHDDSIQFGIEVTCSPTAGYQVYVRTQPIFSLSIDSKDPTQLRITTSNDQTDKSIEQDWWTHFFDWSPAAAIITELIIPAIIKDNIPQLNTEFSGVVSSFEKKLKLPGDGFIRFADFRINVGGDFVATFNVGN